MGRLLTNKTNVDNADADYPNGRIKDDTGSNNGTPVDEDVYGDLHQTEERGVQEARDWEADVQMDRNADSRLNDYQFFQARRKNQPVAELYKNGYFTDVLTNLGAVDFVADCFVFQGELYVADQGSNDVEVFKLQTGAAARTIGNGVFGDVNSIQIIATGSFGEGLLYGLDNVNNDIRVFNATTGARQLADEINTVIGAPISFQIDKKNDRIYVLDNGNRVETFNLTTAVHIPGESFGITAGGLDIAITPHRDRIYILYAGQTRAFTIAGAAVVAEDIGGLTVALKFHVVAEKMYIIDNAPTDILVFDIRKITNLPLEDVLNAVIGGVNNLHIRNGVLYGCFTGTNDVRPVGAVNVQEYV
jgi:hypothetical protein